MRVRAWAGLHPKLQDRTGHGTKGPSPIVRMTLVLVEVSRLPGATLPAAGPLALAACPGGYTPDLDLLWRAYVRRFDLEHTFRFLKQTLGWQTLRVRHPEQADRWTWLVLAAYTQLRLARALVADRRLPWDGGTRRAASPPTASAGRFRHCCWRSARPPACHNPAAARPAAQGPPLRPRAAPSGHQEGRLTPFRPRNSLTAPILTIGAVLRVVKIKT